MMLQKVYYRKESPNIKAQNEVEDERLQNVMTQSPLLNAIYRGYQNRMIDYEEMLNQMVIQGNRQHNQIMAEHLKYLERYGTPIPPQVEHNK